MKSMWLMVVHVGIVVGTFHSSTAAMALPGKESTARAKSALHAKQSTAPAKGQNAGSPTKSDSPQSDPSANASAGAADPRPGRAPLIREGAFLVQAVGEMDRDGESGQWIFRPRRVDTKSKVDREMFVLPSQGLEDMVRLCDDDRPTCTFELTAEVFVYAGKNYVLPVLSTLLAESTDPSKSTVPSSSPALPNSRPNDVSASQIERALEAKIGTVARSGAPTSRSSSGGTGFDDGTGPASSAPQMLREGRIAMRRGSVVRNSATGGWRLVFDADGSGKADPSVEILPCQTLERIEKLARMSDGTLTIDVSGHILAYHNRSYLLPSSFVVPVSTTPIRRTAHAHRGELGQSAEKFNGDQACAGSSTRTAVILGASPVGVPERELTGVEPIFCTASIPEMTLPNAVYSRSRC